MCAYDRETFFFCVCVGLIVWRIRSIDSEFSTPIPLPRRKLSRFSKIIRIIIESGLLYSAIVVFSFVTELTGSNVVYPVADVVSTTLSLPFYFLPRSPAHSHIKSLFLAPATPALKVPSIVGISFNLIIIRVNKCVTGGGTYLDTTQDVSIADLSTMVFRHPDTAVTDMSTACDGETSGVTVDGSGCGHVRRSAGRNSLEP